MGREHPGRPHSAGACVSSLWLCLQVRSVRASPNTLRTEVSVPDYSRLGDDGLPLELTVELDPKKDFKQNAKLCFKQARGSRGRATHGLPL